MYSSKDLERLWFLYKTEGEPKGISINSFCVTNNVPYTVFYDWYKKTQKKAVPVEVVGVPVSSEKEELSYFDTISLFCISDKCDYYTCWHYVLRSNILCVYIMFFYSIGNSVVRFK